MAKTISPINILRTTISLYKNNKTIFTPYIVLVFINLLFLQILYFSPKYPLSAFFSQITSRIFGEQFLHYPYDLTLLPKLYYYAQLTIYIFIGCILLGACAHMVSAINNDETVNFKNSVKRSFGQYIHILLATILSLLLFQGLTILNNMAILRAYKIRSASGIFFGIKKAIIVGSPYFQYLFGIIIAALLVYIIPIIVIEKKKIFSAIAGNFRSLWKSFWVTLVIVLLPNLLYLPILVLRNNVYFLGSITVPEMQVWLLVLSIFAATAIDLFVISAATINYLFIKENS